MNIHLTRELQLFIERKLASGRYSSASEVVREGLRLLAEEDELRAQARRKVAEGLADLKAGRVVRELFRLDDLTVRVYGDMAIVFGLETEKSKIHGKDRVASIGSLTCL